MQFIEEKTNVITYMANYIKDITREHIKHEDTTILYEIDNSQVVIKQQMDFLTNTIEDFQEHTRDTIIEGIQNEYKIPSRQIIEDNLHTKEISCVYLSSQNSHTSFGVNENTFTPIKSDYTEYFTQFQKCQVIAEQQLKDLKNNLSHFHELIMNKSITIEDEIISTEETLNELLIKQLLSINNLTFDTVTIVKLLEDFIHEHQVIADNDFTNNINLQELLEVSIKQPQTWSQIYISTEAKSQLIFSS